MDDPEQALLILGRILVGLLAAINCLFGAFDLFILIVFFGNFRFDNALHFLILGTTMLHAIIAIWTGILCFREPTRFRLAMMMVSGCLFWVLVKLYDSPDARGLIH